jgi:CheY-like chemotaxis protein
VRQAIEHFDLSRVPEGITASRYPSDLGQYIPTFSPIWVAMVHDYWMHRDDPEYVRGFLPGIRSVLSWFERRLDETGMLGRISWWPYVDWAKEWDRGVPPGGAEGHSSIISLQFVYALERAAELEQGLGVPALADRYRSVAQKVRDAVRSRSWNAARGLFRDTPEGDIYSQQANVMAVLTDTVAPADQAAVMERVLSDRTLTHSTYYFSYYQLEALLKAGLGERYVDQLAPWREMLNLGLTTVPETPEPTRSDSHAWSAHPNYGLLATVLGVRPAVPGFKTVRIAPTSVRCSGPRAACPIPWEPSWCGWPEPKVVGCAARLPCRKDSRACWSGAGRQRPCDPDARNCRFEAPLRNLVSTFVHVALIDDAEPTRIALARLLASAGFQPAAFASAEEFLMCASDLRFDCLVLDVHLPGLSGLDLFRRLRRDGARTPVVFLTADQHVARCEEIRAAGVSCLVKPTDDVTLFTAIRNAVDSALDNLA